MDNVYLKINTTHNARRHNADSIHDSAKDILGAQCHDAGRIKGSQERQEMSVKSKLDKKHNEITNIVYKLGDENLRRTNEKGTEQVTVTERVAKEIGTAVERNGAMDRELGRKQADENMDLLQHHHNSAMDNHKDTQLDICELENDVSVGAVENKSDLEMGISQGESAVTLDEFYKAHTLSLEECEKNAKTTLDAFKNKAKFEAEAADCCCEIKEHTVVKERETQSVAKQIDTRRMRDELALANTENLLLRFM